jgi:hypothetical protein
VDCTATFSENLLSLPPLENMGPENKDGAEVLEDIAGLECIGFGVGIGAMKLNLLGIGATKLNVLGVGSDAR